MSYTIPAIVAHPRLYAPPFPYAIIVAMAQRNVIGCQGQLPWHLPEDLRFFRVLTTGHSIVMGRKTWESLPHALPNRQNIVLTRHSDYLAPGAQTIAFLDQALEITTLPAPIFCIGGGELYRQALPQASVLFLTEIDHELSGDTFFPEVATTEWRRVIHEPHQQADGARLRYAFNVYVREALWQAHFANGGQEKNKDT